MPSKFQMILVIVVLVVGVWGASQVDWTRNVPRFPPDFGGGTVAVGTGAADAALSPPADPPPDKPVDSGGIVKPPEDESGEVRLKDIRLQKVNSPSATPVEDTGTDAFVLIRVGKEGELFWGGMAAGSYDMIGKLFRQNAGRDDLVVVIAADRATPWMYVYWVMQVAKESGVYDIGLGVCPSYDEEGTLLAMLKTPMPEGELDLPADLPELVIELTEDEEGKAQFTAFGQKAESLRDLYEKLSGFNSDYAEELGVDYSRNPAKSPWLLKAAPHVKTGNVLVTIDATRLAAVYTLRYGGEFPSRPGKKR